MTITIPEDISADLRMLRMTGFAAHFYNEINADTEALATPEELFYNAVKAATAERKANRVAKAIKNAGFPYPQATITDLIDVEERKLNVNKLRRLTRQNWRQDSANVQLRAVSGTGKTYLACLIGVAACQNGHSVTYARFDKLLAQLAQHDVTSLEYQTMMSELVNVDLLILDDFMTTPIDARGQSDLSTIVFDRHERLPMIIISQSTASFWRKRMPDAVNGDSIVNRLATGYTVELNDYDVRKKVSQDALDNELANG